MNAPGPRRPVLEEFEPRILYAADFAPLVLAGLADVQLDAQHPGSDATAAHEIAFVDLSLPDAQSLIDDLAAQARAGRAIEVVGIAADDDGLARIGDTLAGRHDVTAVHLLSHGSDGAVQLGATRLDATTLLTRAGDLAAWGAAFGADADLLIYGCDVAAAADGRALIAQLAQLTGADVAASDDLTGAAARGGDWTLEVRTGAIEAALAPSLAEQDHVQGTLALLANDAFATSGNLAGTGGGTGWAGAWSGSGTELQVVGGNLSDPSGLLVTSGGSVKAAIGGANATVQADRDLAVPVGTPGTSTWISLLVRPGDVSTGAGTGLVFGGSTLGAAGIRGDQFWIGQTTGPGMYGAGSTVSGVTAQAGEDHLLVIRIDHALGNDTATLYVDPTPGVALTSVPSATVTNLDFGAFTRLSLTSTNGAQPNRAQFDELRVGQTYADVTPILAAGNAPTITSNGGATNVAIAIDENTTAVTRVQATTADLVNGITYSISGGADAAKFRIGASTGVLEFIAAPDYESPTDAGANNVYDVVVRATTLLQFDEQSFAVTVNDLGGPLVVTTAADTADGDTRSVEALLGNRGADGMISLREAILAANATAGADRIEFAIPGTGVRTIAVQSVLPTITDALTIDGSTQAGGDGTPRIEISGAALTGNEDGLVLDTGSSGSTLLSLVVNGFAHSNIVVTGGSAGNVIAGNYVGVNASGNAAVGGSVWGIDINAAGAGNLIGGGSAALANIVGGGDRFGGIAVNGSPDTFVMGNYIGVARDGTTSLGNGVGVLVINNTAGSRIGGTTAGAGNVIAGNAASGVVVQGTTASVAVLGNRVYGNGAMAIDMAADGAVQANDTLDADSGSNGLQNYPVISVAEYNGAALHVSGVLDSRPSSYYRVEFYADAAGESNAHGEGRVYLGATLVATNGSGRGTFDLSFATTGVTAGQIVTATATASNSTGTTFAGTSEFALNRTIVSTATAPVIDSGASFTVNENATAVTTLAAHDVDLPAQVLTWSIVGGADAARFVVDAASGALAFRLAPDFEAPADAGADNVYDVLVQVSDGALTDTHAFSVTVRNVNDAPTAAPDAYATAQDTPLVVTTGGVLANDGDADGNALVVVGNTAPTHGTVSFAVSGLATPVALTSGGTTFTAAEWSPDGSKLVFDSTRTGNGDIYVVNADGSGLVRLTSGSAVDLHPAWSPDGTKIAFASTRSGNYEVWVMNAADGSGLTQLTTSGSSSASARPVWSPDGTRIAFESNRNAGSYDLYVMDADGRNVTRLTSVSGNDGQPSWSPDGTRIVFSAVRSGNTDLYVINADGSGLARLTSNAAVDQLPAWSPDGGRIAFVSDRSGSNQAWVMGADGTNPVRLTSEAGGVSSVAWSPDGSALVYVGGGDVKTAALRLDGAFTYTPDAGFHGTDSFTYTVSDGAGGTATATVTIAVDAAPQITSGAAASVAENTTAVMTVTATDADLAPPQTLAYRIAGGADAALFQIDAASGALSFLTAPDREAPADAGADNVYDVIVEVGDGNATATQAIRVTVTDTNDNDPVIAGGATDARTSPENWPYVRVLTATDADAGSTLTYSIVGGADAAKFGIGNFLGLRYVYFRDAPDFEAPADSNADNAYEVILQVSDGTRTATQAMTVRITDVNEAPQITSPGAVTVDDGQTAVLRATATDPDAGDTIAWSISGTDAAKFRIDAATGVLTFRSAPDAGAPGDAGADNVYDVVVTASDGQASDSQALAVTVRGANHAPVITGGGAAPIGLATPENRAAIGSLAATDADADTLTWSLVGGADRALFRIDAATGALAFVAAPDFETPQDAGADNVYDVVVQVSDGRLATTQAVAVAVQDVNEAPVLSGAGTATVAENDTAVTTLVARDPDAGATLRYAIVGGADAARFAIDAATGALRFAAAPNFEAPQDANADNRYELTVQASDGTLAGTMNLTVIVADRAEAPAITTNALAIAEGGSAVPQLASVDEDTPADRRQYTVTGGGPVGGRFEFVDAAGTAITRFTQADVDAGRVRFVHDGSETVPAYAVSLDDGTQATGAQAATVTYTPVDDAPVVGVADLGTLPEDTPRIVTAAELLASAADAEGDALRVSGLVVGSGQGTLVDLGGGRWQFTPAADWHGSVRLDYTVDDGTLAVAAQARLEVTAVNDAPVPTSFGGASTAALAVAENGTAVGTVAGTDVDGPAPLAYAIVGGADAARFTIDAATGALRFVAAPDHETPLDADADNRYDVVVAVSDGLLRAEQALAVTVTNVDEAPVIVANSLTVQAAANGGGTSLVLVAVDPDTPASALVYQASGVAGGQFERVAAPGVAVTSFTQAQVDAGAIRFAVDGSGTVPAYALQLSDGVSAATAGGAPTIVVPPPPPPPAPPPPPPPPAPTAAPAASPTDTAQTLPAPAAEVAVAPVRAAGAVPTVTPAAPAATPATSTTTPATPATGPGAAGSGAVAEPGAAAPAATENLVRAAASSAAPVTATLFDAGHRAAFEVDPVVLAAEAPAQIDLVSTSVPTLAPLAESAPIDLASALRESSLAQALEPLRHDAEGEQYEVAQFAAGGTALTAGVSVGYVLWLARGGVLMASVLAALPAWASLDPLPVLGQVHGKGRGAAGAPDDDDDAHEGDAVEQLFSQAPAPRPPSSAAQGAPKPAGDAARAAAPEGASR